MACFFHIVFHAVLIWIVLPGFLTDEAGYFNSTFIRELLISSHEESVHIVNEAFRCSRQRRSASTSSSHMFTFSRQTEPETLGISRAAEVFQTTVQVLRKRAQQRCKRNVTASGLLSREDVALIAELSHCPPAAHPDVCRTNSKYRSISGICNNRQNPLWGAANTPLVRWLPAEYEDGEREPRGWNRGRLHNGFQLPSPWEVSKRILRGAFKSQDDIYSLLLVEWGQYIDHDVTFTPQSTGTAALWSGVDCLSTCENVHPCFPIETHNFHTGTKHCLPFHRSTPACFVHPGSDIEQVLQRQQMNAITSFMDASLVYGHSSQLASFLRDLPGLNGKLAVNEQFKDPKGRAYLPFVASLPSTCRQGLQQERVECFSAGDSRVNEGMPLTSLHTLWLREHNRIAEALKSINGHWSPEMIFQETRKIIGALHQTPRVSFKTLGQAYVLTENKTFTWVWDVPDGHNRQQHNNTSMEDPNESWKNGMIITMRDYVPKIIGPESFDDYVGPYRGYDPTTDPSASNVFATAAFRFGHATIPPILRRLNESFQPHERFPHLRLHDTFFSPWRIVKEGGVEPVLRGIIGTAAPVVSTNMLMAEELTERLIVPNVSQHMDLASLNLQRGRDHGLPGYNDWRVFCGLTRMKTLDDLKEVVGDDEVAEMIQTVYKHLDNIDVWLGGLVERSLPGSRTGALFSCLIGKQMKALRDGDRFWWEAEGVFTQQKKAELSKVSLSRIICDNTDIREVPYDSFRFGNYPTNYVPCNQIPSMNVNAWRDDGNRDVEQCGSPPKIKNGDFILSYSSGKPAALYSCYHGFQLKGAAALVCEENRWSDKPPQCKGNRH